MKRIYKIIAKTFGGLTIQYYASKVLIASVMLLSVLYVVKQGGNSLAPSKLYYLCVCTALYPYSRFVFESIGALFLGEKRSLLMTPFLLLIKPFIVVGCWVYAIFIAPVALIYMYCFHSKKRYSF